METRNVIDHYHYWKHEAILADLDSKRKNYSILCSNLYNDFNISTVIRNANAFLASKVIIYGSKQYDRRGAVGTQNYTRFQHYKTTEELKNYLIGLDIGCEGRLKIVGIDNISTAKPIDEYEWDVNTHYVIAFGQEQVGLPEEVLDMCDDLLYIKQYGSVRSLNVGTASGIVMYDYCSKIKVHT
jgi:tRNA G18 (ribose-2'-O)-methylase SpoU